MAFLNAPKVYSLLPKTPQKSKNVKEFNKKLKGPLIITKYNFIHLEYTRLITLCDQIKGLSLDDSYKQLKWHR